MNVRPGTKPLRDKWKGQMCHLMILKDKVDAKITSTEDGRFAVVVPLNCALGGFEYCWETVDRIMSRDGVFK